MRQSTRTAKSAEHKAVRLIEQRRVERAQDEVFIYTADFSNIEDWDPGVVSSRQLGQGLVGVGSQFELEVKFGGGTMPMVYEITEYEPSDRVVLVGRGDRLIAVDDICFSRHDNMTVIDYTADLTFLNWFRHLTRFMGPSLKKIGTKALDGLSAELDR